MTVSGAAAPLPDERRAQVIALLRRRGVLRVTELASELDVSAITVRRDIARLASQGLIRRVRGGAALPGATMAADALISQMPEVSPPPESMPEAAGEAGIRATVGMVVPSLDYYWPDVIRGVREAAAASGTRVVLRGATYQAADERRQLSWLVDSVGVDGLLVAPTTTGEDGEELVRWLQSADVPVVLVERAAAVGPYREAMESVVSDHAFGAAMAVRHLAGLGHRRIGVVTTMDSPTSPHVRRGWRQACEELGLGPDDAVDANTVDRRDPEWPHALNDLLDRCSASRTTALLVHSDPEAISLVEACQERGIRIPEDLAVVAYDDEVAELCEPPLTAVRPPKSAVGHAAFGLLSARLADDDAHRPRHRVVIEPRLVVRSSSS